MKKKDKYNWKKISKQCKKYKKRMTKQMDKEFLKKCNKFYPILGRISPLLSEAKVGNECRLHFY